MLMMDSMNLEGNGWVEDTSYWRLSGMLSSDCHNFSHIFYFSFSSRYMLYSVVHFTHVVAS